MANNEQDLLWVYNPTQAPFKVEWSGYPYELKSGEKRILPRFIAQHFAKHLADAILMRKEQKIFEDTGKMPALVAHPVERPKVVGLILLGVYSYHQGAPSDPGSVVAQMVDEVNKAPQSDAPQAAIDDELVEDYGFVPDIAIGNLATPPDPTPVDISDSQPDPLAPDNDGTLLEGVDDDKTEPTDLADGQPIGKKKKTRAELIEEAEALGLDFDKKVSTERLEQMIKAF